MNQIQDFCKNLPDDIDAALITSVVSRQYLLGFKSSAGTLVATKDKSFFIVDSRYFEAAQETVKGCEVVLQDKLSEQLVKILKTCGARNIGVETESISFKRYLELKEKFKGFNILESGFVSEQIAKQRSIKSCDEIASMQAAQDIADKTFTYILGYIKTGMTEIEIAIAMEDRARLLGSEKPSFDYIVAAGANSSRPHAVPSGNKVKRGDFITLDFGCTINGYCSDMTRTVAVGEVSGKQREVYELVLHAQSAALEVIKPGICCFDVDKCARDIIDATAYKGLFGHGLGHSLGLEIHEEPRFNTECKTILEPGVCMSVEPGIYLPGEFGVRIEDVVAVTKNGYHNFCKSDKKLIIL